MASLIECPVYHMLPEFIYAADRLLSETYENKLVVKKIERDSYEFEVVPFPLCERISALFGYANSDMTSVRDLKEIIGFKRFELLFEKEELQLDNLLHSESILLTKEIVKKILIGLAHITKTDLEEHAKLQGKPLNDLSVKEIDACYEELFPLKKIEEIFLRHCAEVPYFDKAWTAGKGFEGLQERVWIVHRARNHVLDNVLNTDSTVKIAEVEMLTSRLADREPPVGTVVRLHDGYYAVDRLFVGGGAHVSAYVGLSSAKRRLLLVCRGTAGRYNSTGGFLSVVNDGLKEIGSLGVKSVWPSIREYLREEKVSEVEIFGKSLGGAHALYLTTLIGGTTPIRIDGVNTCNSVGVPERVQELFVRDVLNGKSYSPELRALRSVGEKYSNDHDYVPYVGGVHLHTPSTTRVYYLHSEEVLPPQYHFKEQFVSKILLIFKSLKFAHCRQLTLRSFHVYESKNIHQDIRVGTYFEPVRQFFANLFDYMTFGWVNGESFEEYYLKER